MNREEYEACGKAFAEGICNGINNPNKTIEKLVKEWTEKKEMEILKEMIADGMLKTFEGVETVRSIKEEVFVCNATTRAELCYKNYNFAECDFIISELLEDNELYIITDTKLKQHIKEKLEKNKIMLPQTALEIIEKDRDKKCDTLATLPPSAQINATELKEMIKAQGVAVLALEKQIKKKPITEDGDYIIRYYCPSCKSYLGQRGKRDVIIFKKETYCQQKGCGQYMDWSGEN